MRVPFPLPAILLAYMKANDQGRSIAEIVRNDYRTSDVFRAHGINYCCDGNVTLEETCESRGLNYDEILKELEQATRTISLSNKTRFNEWKIDFLIDYIVNIHHAYLYDNLTPIQESVNGFANSHRSKFPYLPEVEKLVENLSVLILNHNRHEEEIIFPYIKQIDNAYRRKETYGSLFVKTLRKPFGSIESEHNKITQLLLELRSITNHYTYPVKACTNHRVVFHKLKELDNDLQQHKHLENNILFPRVTEMEKELLKL